MPAIIVVLSLLTSIATPALAQTGFAAVRDRAIVVEATLLAHSDHSGIRCGVLYVHQVAKYRIDRLVTGSYSGDVIVVDHPACDGDVFRDIPVGSSVRLYIRATPSYNVRTNWPGIREKDTAVDVYFVANRPPQLLCEAALLGPCSRNAAQLAVAPEPAQLRQCSSVSAVARAR
jgi:hypothetical protein